MTSQISQRQVKDIVAQKFVEKLRLAYFVVDSDLLVRDFSSNLVDYGFPALNTGEPVEDKIDFMIGMNADISLDLPFVNSPSGASVCVSLVPTDQQLMVLISDASDTTLQRKLLQQAANENELLVEKQIKLMADLEATSTLLEQKNLELEEASRLQTSFLSGVSHEFRTPLTSIVGYTNLVKSGLAKMSAEIDSYKPVRDQHHERNSIEYLSAVQRSSKHLMSLVENLLDHGKLDSDEIVIRPKPTPIVEIFNDVELLLKPLSQTKSIELKVDLQDVDSQTHIVVDDSRLRQCLINLVGNAIKFTDFGGVTVQAKLQGENLDVVISDTGMGISEEDLEKIRLPFYQAADTGKVGTGLGLTITERIIEMMGGDMDIHSELGKGTTVRFDLAAPLFNQTSEHQSVAPFTEASHLSILLAEDDPDIADLVILMLDESGVEVTHVANGALAVEAVQNNDFDMVLMDIHMPIMTGYEAIEELNRLGSKTPIVVMSASAIEADQQKATELGCASYLMKPVDANEIIAMAQTLVK